MRAPPIRGLELLAQREASVYDLAPPLGLKYYQDGIRAFSRQDGVKGTNIMNNAIQRPSTSKVLGCKSNREAHKVLRRPALPEETGMYAPTGYARHQPKGLATLNQRPTDGQIMPLASSFYGGGNNKLGQPSG